MGGKGGGGSESTVRFAPYIEEHHSTFLNEIADRVDDVIDDSPFTDYSLIDINPAFFGTGYVLSSFPSLYDMYGKFMAGLDIEVIFDQEFEDTLNGAAVGNLISAQATELSDDLENEAFPRFETGMRDINSVVSSSFIVGKSIMEAKREQELSRFAAELRYRLIPVAVDRWKTHLEWNKAVVMTYAELMKLYFTAAIDMEEHTYSMVAKDKLWPFTVLEYQRAALGALTGARNEKTSAAGTSKISGALGGAMSGASAGSAIMPGWGTAIGAVVGGIGGFLSGS